MNKKVAYFSIFTVLLTLVSCLSTDEKQKKDIIGSYYYTTTKESQTNIVTIENHIRFKASGKVESYGTITITIFDESVGKCTMKYNMIVNGDYDIKNSYIIYNYDINNINISPVKTENSLDSYMTRYLSSVIEEHLVPAMKEELIKNNESKIIELTDKKLIIEEDKEQLTYTRD